MGEAKRRREGFGPAERELYSEDIGSSKPGREGFIQELAEIRQELEIIDDIEPQAKRDRLEYLYGALKRIRGECSGNPKAVEVTLISAVKCAGKLAGLGDGPENISWLSEAYGTQMELYGLGGRNAYRGLVYSVRFACQLSLMASGRDEKATWAGRAIDNAMQADALAPDDPQLVSMAISNVAKAAEGIVRLDARWNEKAYEMRMRLGEVGKFLGPREAKYVPINFCSAGNAAEKMSKIRDSRMWLGRAYDAVRKAYESNPPAETNRALYCLFMMEKHAKGIASLSDEAAEKISWLEKAVDADEMLIKSQSDGKASTFGFLGDAAERLFDIDADEKKQFWGEKSFDARMEAARLAGTGSQKTVFFHYILAAKIAHKMGRLAHDQMWWRNSLAAAEEAAGICIDAEPHLKIMPYKEIAFSASHLAQYESEKAARLELYDKSFKYGSLSLDFARQHGIKGSGSVKRVLYFVCRSALKDVEVDPVQSEIWRGRMEAIG